LAMKPSLFLRTTRRIILFSVCLLACTLLPAGILYAGGKKPEGEIAEEPAEQSGKVQDPSLRDAPLDLSGKNVYDLIREGTEEELRGACDMLGLPSDGDMNELRKRLMEWEMGRSLLPFDEELKGAPEEVIILKNADFIRYTEAENGDELILLSGNVDVVFGGKEVKADEVEINSSRKLITGTGSVRFLDGENIYVGESFFYDDVNDEGYFYSSKTSLGAFIYRGDVIRKIQEEEKYAADEVYLSTEDIKNPHYWIAAEKLYFYDAEKVLIKNGSIYYGQDELIRLPYMYRNLRERKLRTALYYRERSGLVWQNTFTPYRTDEKEVILKGDFYERLGLYTGVEYNVADNMNIDLSVALSKDVYYYPNLDNPADVTENWSNLGPPYTTEYDIYRSFRHKEGFYKKFEFGQSYTNVTELNLLYISDPYYEYDYERRSAGFDFFQFLNQAQIDSPTKGSGYAWYLNNNFNVGTFDWYLKNTFRFEPQRNESVEYASLNDYYEYRLYSFTAPQTGVIYTDTLFEESSSVVVADMALSSVADYSYTQYYNPDETVSSKLHRANGAVGIEKPYYIGNFLRFTPNLIAGGRGQEHLDPTSEQTSSDDENTLIYAQIIDGWRFGVDQAYFDLTHNLRLKVFGPEDGYQYNRFRIHEMTMTGFAQFWYFSDELRTTYDLRPTYDWTTGSYEPFVWDRSHFQPLINTFRFSYEDRYELKDVLVYSIVDSRFKTNQFSFGYTSPDIPMGRNKVTVSWDLEWHHNFINPVVDYLQSIFRVDADIRQFWKFYVRTLSLNEDIWRYFPSVAESRGAEPINPLQDLLKSFNFFNTDARKASYFKLKNVSFGFVRDLHEWELFFDYTGNRVLLPGGGTYQWEQTFTIGLGLKKVEDARIYTTVQSSQ